MYLGESFSYVYTNFRSFHCLSVCSQAYQERSKLISEQLSALKTQMDDLKMEDRMTRNDLLHEESIRLGNNKRLALDKVCICLVNNTVLFSKGVPLLMCIL